MKSTLTKVQVLGLLIALPALANDVGLHKGSAQPTRAVMVAQARVVDIKSPNNLIERTVGICQLVPNYGGVEIAGDHHLDPLAVAENYLWIYEYKANNKAEIEQEKIQKTIDDMEKSVVVQILQQPKHGVLGGTDEYAFSPKLGYLGNDQVVAQVEIGNYKIRLNYYVKVIDTPVGNGIEEKYCGTKGHLWKISTPNTDPTTASPRRLG